MDISFINDEYSASIDDALSFARKNQFRYIELRTLDGKNIIDFTASELAAISHKIAQAGVLVSQINSPFLYWPQGEKNFSIMGQVVDSQEDYFIKLMDVADILGAQNISIYSYLQSSHLEISALGDDLDKYSQMALERGIGLQLNINANCTISNINKIHQLFENYNFSNIHPLLNTGKIIASEDDFTPQELQDIINTCHYFHLSDYDAELKRYVVLGEGNVDFAQFLQDKIADSYTIFSLCPTTTHPEDLAMSFNQLVSWLDD